MTIPIWFLFFCNQWPVPSLHCLFFIKKFLPNFITFLTTVKLKPINSVTFINKIMNETFLKKYPCVISGNALFITMRLNVQSSINYGTTVFSTILPTHLTSSCQTSPFSLEIVVFAAWLHCLPWALLPHLSLSNKMFAESAIEST